MALRKYLESIQLDQVIVRCTVSGDEVPHLLMDNGYEHVSAPLELPSKKNGMMSEIALVPSILRHNLESYYMAARLYYPTSDVELEAETWRILRRVRTQFSSSASVLELLKYINIFPTEVLSNNFEKSFASLSISIQTSQLPTNSDDDKDLSESMDEFRCKILESLEAIGRDMDQKDSTHVDFQPKIDQLVQSKNILHQPDRGI